jgi:hypothetical protein
LIGQRIDLNPATESCMRTLLKISNFALLAALSAAVVEGADPFGRVDRGAAVDPAPQICINQYAVPAPAKLPSMRLAALGQVVRIGRLGDAYRATAPGELPAAQIGTSYTAAPSMLPTHQSARPLAPTAASNAPATITRDRAVVPAAYGSGAAYGANTRTAAAAAFDSGANPLRRAERPTDRSTNPLR